MRMRALTTASFLPGSFAGHSGSIMEGVARLAHQFARVPATSLAPLGTTLPRAVREPPTPPRSSALHAGLAQLAMVEQLRARAWAMLRRVSPVGSAVPLTPAQRQHARAHRLAVIRAVQHGEDAAHLSGGAFAKVNRSFFCSSYRRP